MRSIGAIAIAILVAVASACGGGDEAAAPAAPVAVDRTQHAEKPDNHAPVIRSVRLDPAEPIDGDRVNAIVSVADQDGDPVQLGFEWQISGRSVPTGESHIDLKGVTKRDRISLAVKASDGRLQSETARVEAQVRNQRPTIIAIGVNPAPTALPGEKIAVTAEANDPDRDPVSFSYQWRVNGQLQMETGDTLDTDDLKRGDKIQAIAVASDGTAESDKVESVVVRIGNSHPEILSVPEGNWTTEGFSYEVKARDPDNDGPLRYALKAGPRGMRVDSVLGKVTWQPTPDQAGVHPIEIAVSDSEGATSVQQFEITVKTEESAQPPAAPRK